MRENVATKLTHLAALFLLLTASAQAAVSVQVSPGTDLSVPYVVDFSPNGFTMDGLKVTAYFGANGSEQVTWQAVPNTTSGQATGTGWFLRESGDTFFNAWELQNNTPFLMTGLLIEGGIFGHTVFDVQGLGRTTAGLVFSGDFDTTTGTTDSERGYTFDPLDPDIATNSSSVFPGLDVTADYLNRVKLNAAVSPVGDLWTSLQINFGGPAGGLVNGPSLGGAVPFYFYADTDITGNLNLNPPVPEPSSLVLFVSLGLVGAWQCRRRNFRRRLEPS